MSGQAQFKYSIPSNTSFLNMSNLGMLNNQNTSAYQKAMRDAANHVQLQKLGKKQLQQIAKELNIPEKIKKEEIVSQIPEALLKCVFAGDLARPIEYLLQQMPALRNNQIIMEMLKKFQEQIHGRTPSFQQMQRQQVNLPQMMQNPYLPYVIMPQAQQTQQQLLAQYPQMLNMNLYQQQMRQPNAQQYFMPQQYQWMENMQVPQQEVQQLLMCPCKTMPSKRTTNEEVVCINCDQKLHMSCMKLQPNDVKMFECPICTLSKIDPLNQIIKVLQKPVLMNAQQTQLNFMISAEEFHQLQDRSYQVEIRSIRLEAKYMNETTWPDFCEIYVNQNRFMEFKPLKSNSSLKKRKDEVQVVPIQAQSLTIFIKQGYNQVVIKEGSPYQEPKAQFKLCEDGVYVFAIYLTKKRPPQELINQIKQNKDQISTKEECLQFIQKACMAEKTDAEVQIDKVTIKVSLKCQFDCQMIQTPARGRFCTHVQCFSLENTITINAGTSRKWKCPVCKKKIFEFMIDQYQYTLLEKYRNDKVNVKEIVFDSDGEIMQEIQEDIEESEEEQISHNNHNPQEEQVKQQQFTDPLVMQANLQRFLLQMNPAAAIFQHLYQQRGAQLQLQQQQQFQQKEKPENLHFHQNKGQLKQLVEQNIQNLETKQLQLSQQLANQTISKPKHIKIKKFEAWLEESITIKEMAQEKIDQAKIVQEQAVVTVTDDQSQQQQQQMQLQLDKDPTEQQQPQSAQSQQPQSAQLQPSSQPQPLQVQQPQQAPEVEKINQKSIKLKERLVRVIKKQFSEFIRKNFANIDPTKGQSQIQQTQLQQSGKKYIYKLSEEKSKAPSNLQFNKQLADQIFLQNPGHSIEKSNEDAKQSAVDDQIKQLQSLLPLGLTPPPSGVTPFLNQKTADHALLIQKSLSSQTPQSQIQPPMQIKIKEKIQKIKSPQPSNDEINGKDMENPICID